MNCSFKRLEFITEHRNVENPSLASLRIIWLKYCSLDSWTRFIHLLEKKLSKLSPCDDDIYWLHAPDAYKSNLLRNTLYCRVGSNQIINSVSILIWFYSGFLAGEEQHHLPQNHVTLSNLQFFMKTWASETQAPSFFFLEDIWVEGRDADGI